MITAYGGLPAWPAGHQPTVLPTTPQPVLPGVNPDGFGIGGVRIGIGIELSRLFSDSIHLVLARGLSWVVSPEVGPNGQQIVKRLEVYPQTNDPDVLFNLQGLGGTMEVQVRVNNALEYRAPLAAVLVLDSVLTRRIAAMEARMAAYEAELLSKLAAAGGDPGESLVVTADEGYTTIHTPIILEPGMRLEVSLMGLPSANHSRTAPCNLLIALACFTKEPVR